MSQQSLNARQVVQIVRRRKILVGAVTLVGLVAGIAISVLSPPLVSSQALVVLPQGAPPVATEAVIAASVPVLSRALPEIAPPMSLQTLQNRLSAQGVTSIVISVTAEGKSSAQAESAANAVANSYIAYVGVPDSPGGQLKVHLLESATTTTGMKPATQDALYAGLGVLAGLVVGIVMAVIVGRRGHRLLQLDDFANSIGVPVLAAIPVGQPSDATGWTRLLDDYEPDSVEAWRLHQALREIASAGASANGTNTSVTVLSMPSDLRALALGPQLAAFGASLGLPTLLVVGPQQDTNATAALYTACAAPQELPKRSRYLRIVAADTARVAIPSAAKLVIGVAVAEGKAPQMPETLPTAVTVLAVTAGSVTAEQLARLAMAATSDGRDVIGLFVADPDPSDRTSGRFPRRSAASAASPSGATKPVSTSKRETDSGFEPRPVPETRSAAGNDSGLMHRAEPEAEPGRGRRLN